MCLLRGTDWISLSEYSFTFEMQIHTTFRLPSLQDTLKDCQWLVDTTCGTPVTLSPRVVLQHEGSVHVAFTHFSSHCVQLHYAFCPKFCRAAAIMTVSLLSQRRFPRSVACPQVVTSQNFTTLRLNDILLHGTSLKTCQVGREDPQLPGWWWLWQCHCSQAAVTMPSAKRGVCIQRRLGAAPQPCRGPVNTNTTHHDKPLVKCGLCYTRSSWLTRCHAVSPKRNLCEQKRDMTHCTASPSLPRC